MTRFDLSDEDARALGSALELRLHSLRTELTATDDRQFKAYLREQLNRLERIADRLKQQTAEGERR